MSGARPSWYKPDVGLSMRMVLTIFLLGAVYVVFGVVLAFVAHVPMPLLIAIAALIAFAQFFYADKIALFSMRAREVSEAEAPQLHEMIGRLAARPTCPSRASRSSIPAFPMPSPPGAARITRWSP